MSQIAFQGNASGTGTFTIAAPNSNTNRTLNIPDASGSLVVDGNNINVPSINGGQLAGMRNKIINGKMDVIQRGVAFTAGPGNTSGFCHDRWLNITGTGTTGAFTTSGPSEAPSSNEFSTSLRATVGTADTSIAASDYYLIQQRIEGYNARDLIGRTFTLSFWVRSSKTGTHCISFGNNADRSYVAEYTVIAANTWEYKSITISGGLITTGTWNWANGTGLVVSFALAVGSTGQGVAGSWISTGYAYSTSNQVNCMDTIGNIFAITGVQLEAGSVATPFEHRPYGYELALCQRYYETLSRFSSGFLGSGSSYATWVFTTQKRAAPTVSATTTQGSVYTAATTTAIAWSNASTPVDMTGLVANAEL